MKIFKTKKYNIEFCDGGKRDNVVGRILIRYMREPTRARTIKTITRL